MFPAINARHIRYAAGLFVVSVMALVSASQSWNDPVEVLLFFCVLTFGGVVSTKVLGRNPAPPRNDFFDGSPETKILEGRIRELENHVHSLRASEAWYRRLADSAAAGLWAVSSGGETLYVNDRLTAMLGYDAHEMVGHPLWDFMDDQARKEASAQGRTDPSQEWEEVDFRFTRKDGSDFWAIVSTCTLTDDHGRSLGYLGMLLPANERVRSQQELSAAVRQTKEAKETKSRFFANMSHEMRTPLNVIMGYCELLMDGNLDSKTRLEYAACAHENAHTLTRLADDVLDLAKFDAGEVRFQHTQIPMRSLAAHVVSGFRAKAERKGLRLTVTNDGPMPRTIVSDPVRLRQVIGNLVGNAIKYTQEGEVRVIFAWDPPVTGQAAARLTIHVKDTGMGIPPEYQTSGLFQRFSRAANAREFEGTGLGLSLTHELAQALGGGAALVNSSVNVGSHFTVTVVTEAAENTSFTLDLQPNADSSEVGGDLPSQSDLDLAGLRVLLAEDSKANQLLMRTVLEKAGATVETASDGHDALAKAQNSHHELLVFDIEMPGLDGLSLTAQLRRGGDKRPVIALSGHHDSETEARAQEVGCSDIIAKPCEITRLLEILRRHAPRRRPFLH